MSSDEKQGKRAREPRGGAPDETRRKFRAWVKRLGGSQEVARRLDVSRSYVDMIRSGTRSPGLDTAYRIERLTDGEIRMQDWIARTRRNG